MAVESAGCPYVKVPVPIQDTYSVAEIAILLRVSRNAVYDGVSLERPPAAQEDDGEEEGPLRVQGRAARVEQAPRDVRALFFRSCKAGVSSLFVRVSRLSINLWVCNHSRYLSFRKEKRY